MSSLKPEDFNIGDVVRLNSQVYPRMTVEKVEINLIYVIYMDSKTKEFKRTNFDFGLLSKV